MEASQLRNKSMRAAEPSPMRQLPTAPSTEALIGGPTEANVLELPQRSPLTAEPIAPRPTPPKRQTAKRKPAMTVRQQWVSPQQLLADRVQYLESQAEWINQRLAERSLASAAAPSELQPDLKLQSSQEEDDRLQARLDRIHALLADLGSAIESGKMLEGTELAATEIQSSPAAESGTIAEPPPSVAPPTPQAEQEAAATAATLRHLAERARSQPPMAEPQPPVSEPESQKPRRSPQSSRKRSKRRLKDWLQLPQNFGDRVVDALTWVVVAAVVRLVGRALVAVFPALSPVAIVLMLVPAAIAFGLTVFVPKSGYLPFYRLVLVTIGLLLGGKL